MEALTAADADREVAQQAWELARTEDRKFRWLRWAFRLFGSSLVPAFIGLVGARLGCA